MSHGKVVFDFKMPDKDGKEYEEKDQETIKYAMGKEFQRLDPEFTERLRWMNLIDLPAQKTTSIIRHYLDNEILTKVCHVPPLETGTPSTTYCYSGDQRICYHAFTLFDTEKNADRIIYVKLGSGSRVPIYPLIVLSYETHFS